MEATIQSNQMDLDKEEARPGPDLVSPPQERHVWRILGFPPIPQGLCLQPLIPSTKTGTEQPRKRSGKYAQAFGGGHELLLTHQELSGSGEDHRTLRRDEPIVLQNTRSKDKELVKEPKSFIHRPDKGIGNDSSFGERRTSGVYQLQTSSINVQRQTQGTSEEAERSQEPSRQGKRKNQLAQTLPTRVQDPQIGAFSHVQCFQYGQNSYGIHSQIAGKDEEDFSMKIIDEIHFIKSNIELKPGKFDAKLTKKASDINYLKKNDIVSSEWHESTIDRLHLI
ncbi:hypothetical protein O181_105236 [Austropuccinia psidii MF-1]|uniref:Uncharacterized protein n=1 Tax=Austropuccinia psidii MF-1 TaxID=1389203 RepID=A0A9Q3PM38_9BASI|nr:hypothetical protein [Austropuccinia psidii MF-1]